MKKITMVEGMFIIFFFEGGYFNQLLLTNRFWLANINRDAIHKILKLKYLLIMKSVI